MRHLVLGIGYHSGAYQEVRQEWERYDLDFHFVDGLEMALEMLARHDYVCIAISSDGDSHTLIDELHRIKHIPVVVISPACAIGQRAEYMRHGAMQYILANRRGRYDLSNGDPMRTFLEIPSQELTPLTVITEQELYFCLEYRTVEVRGLSIDLTATEFDLLSMMITNPRRVFTFEMIAALVWDMVCDYTTRRTISNHMGNLRRKLKIAPDVPDFIQNVRGVGYKFNKP